MRPGALLLLILAASRDDLGHLRYTRPVLPVAAAPTQACLPLDATTFAHAAPSLADLRLLRGTTETPYALSTQHLQAQPPAPLAPLNLGVRHGQTSLDLLMPPGSYTDLELDLAARDFLAEVTVTGSQRQADPNDTTLGRFTLFDLTSQHLGRSTVLHLPASDFRYLHLSVTGPLQPGQIRGVTLLRNTTADLAYAPVASTTAITQQASFSVAHLTVPAQVPVDRVVVVPGPAPSALSRPVEVTVTALPSGTHASSAGEEETFPVRYDGDLLRVHRVEDGQRLDEEHFTLSTAGQVSRQPTSWQIRIDNGSDAPLPLVGIRLEMQQHSLCFQAAPGAAYTLAYGDPGLRAPRYDYATLFHPDEAAFHLALGPEQPNTTYQPRPDDRPFTERHPALLWAALLAALGALGAVALRSALPISKDK